MKLWILSNENLIPTASGLPNWVHYLLLSLLFTLIIGFIIFVIFFAKWLTAGPKLKSKYRRITSKITGKKTPGKVTVKGGEIVENIDYLNEIDKKIKNADTPQELLELQILKENHEKSKIDAQNKIREKEDSKLEKINKKIEQKRIRKEAQIKSKEIREKEKEQKSKLKEQKKKGNK